MNHTKQIKHIEAQGFINVNLYEDIDMGVAYFDAVTPHGIKAEVAVKEDGTTEWRELGASETQWHALDSFQEDSLKETAATDNETLNNDHQQLALAI